MKLASAPSRAGSSASICARTRRASTGAAPEELTATRIGERSMMAGKMKLDSAASSTTLTGTPRARAACDTALFTARIVGGRDRRHRAGEVLGTERGGEVGQAAAGHARRERRAQLRRHHGDVRAGLQQAFGLAQRHDAAADDEHRLRLHAQEHRQVVHVVSFRPQWCAAAAGG